MNDIDFDELDRAVSSTLTPTPVSEPTPAPVSPSITTAAAPSVSPAARRGGRFMDVVHPSSDMRGATAVPPRPTVPAEPVTPAVSAAPSAQVSDWPDPIESPFLPDTKVEKRPLGGEQPTTDVPTPVEIPDEAPEAEIIPTVTEPAAPEAVVPVSLKEPVAEPETTPEAEPEVATETTPEVEATPEEPIAEPVPHVTETTQSTPVGDGGPTSIHQQYTESASSAEPSRPIFDTEAYHQPMAHPEKKKSGIFVVLWIIGLIILGAGLGAVMYFYVLPLL